MKSIAFPILIFALDIGCFIRLPSGGAFDLGADTVTGTSIGQPVEWLKITSLPLLRDG